MCCRVKCFLRAGGHYLSNGCNIHHRMGCALGSANHRHERRGFATSQPNNNVVYDAFVDVFMTLSRSPITASVGQTFCQFHDASGLSWSGAIVVSSFVLRFAVSLPAHVTSQKVVAKRAIMYETLGKVYMPALKQAVTIKKQQNNWTEKYAKDLFMRKQRELYEMEVIKRNCASSKIFLPLFLQIPLWVTISMAMRNLSMGGGRILDQAALAEATTRKGQLSTEGFGWVTDLTLPDPIWIIPVTVGTLFLLNNEIAGAKISREVLTQGGQKPLTKRNVLLTNFLRCLSIAMVPIAAQVPAALSLYWTSSAAAGMVVNMIMLSPKFRRAVNIPVTKTDHPTPYRNVWANMKDNARHGLQWTLNLRNLKLRDILGKRKSK